MMYKLRETNDLETPYDLHEHFNPLLEKRKNRDAFRNTCTAGLSNSEVMHLVKKAIAEEKAEKRLEEIKEMGGYRISWEFLLKTKLLNKTFQ